MQKITLVSFISIIHVDVKTLLMFLFSLKHVFNVLLMFNFRTAFFPFSSVGFTVRCECKTFISFHTMDTENTHLFVSNADMKSQRTLISVKNII